MFFFSFGIADALAALVWFVVVAALSSTSTYNNIKIYIRNKINQLPLLLSRKSSYFLSPIIASGSFTYSWIFNSLALIIGSVCVFSTSVVFWVTIGVDGGVFGAAIWGTVGVFDANENPEPNEGSNSMTFIFQSPNFVLVDDNVELLSSYWFQLITIALVSTC